MNASHKTKDAARGGRDGPHTVAPASLAPSHPNGSPGLFQEERSEVPRLALAGAAVCTALIAIASVSLFVASSHAGSLADWVAKTALGLLALVAVVVVSGALIIRYMEASTARHLRAAHAAEERQRLLARVGSALVETLDQPRVLCEVAAIVAPSLCDACIIAVRRSNGELETVAAVPDGALSEADGLVSIGRRVAASSSSIVEQTYVLALPMVARGTNHGVVVLSRKQRQQAFSKEERELCRDVARRCALAVDNARLYRRLDQALASRDEFLLLAAHELRTPVAPLRLATQEMVRRLGNGRGDDPSRPWLLDKARALDDATLRLAELVEHLLDASPVRLEGLDVTYEAFDLVALTRQLVLDAAPAFARAGSPLHFDAPEQLLGAWDRRRLTLALRALLSNALKFGAGGPIEVRVGCSDGHATVSVCDHGPGLSADAQKQIFDRFVRPAPVCHYGGFGLGLWRVRCIAEELGGLVSVHSEPGSGATFTLRLPRRTARVAMAG
jgi:signal transduction histidine kinase